METTKCFLFRGLVFQEYPLKVPKISTCTFGVRAELNWTMSMFLHIFIQQNIKAIISRRDLVKKRTTKSETGGPFGSVNRISFPDSKTNPLPSTRERSELRDPTLFFRETSG